MNEVDPENIADIVRRAQLGDSSAFSVLYTSYFAPLYRYIFSRISDKADAEDLTQEVFLKAYTSFSRYVALGESPLPYFYTIARNRIIDHYRKKKTLVADDEVLSAIVDASDSAEESAAKREEHESLLKEITALPHDQQDAITLRFIENLSTQEIATILGKSEMAVRQLQSRGLRSLKKAISSHKPL